MKSENFYGNTNARSSDWMAKAHFSGFSPLGELIHVAKPYLRTSGRLLDIGCQGGHQMAALDGSFSELYGVDIADYSHMWGQFPLFNFLKHDVDSSSLPFQDEYFDCIIATNILEHVFDVFGLMSEINRLLTPRGTCLISVPNVAQFRRLVSLLKGHTPVTGGNVYPFSQEQGWDGQHLHYFTEKSLTNLFKIYNLEIKQHIILGSLKWLKNINSSFFSTSIDVVIGKK